MASHLPGHGSTRYGQDVRQRMCMRQGHYVDQGGRAQVYAQGAAQRCQWRQRLLPQACLSCSLQCVWGLPSSSQCNLGQPRQLVHLANPLGGPAKQARRVLSWALCPSLTQCTLARSGVFPGHLQAALPHPESGHSTAARLTPPAPVSIKPNSCLPAPWPSQKGSGAMHRSHQDPIPGSPQTPGSCSWLGGCQGASGLLCGCREARCDTRPVVQGYAAGGAACSMQLVRAL